MDPTTSKMDMVGGEDASAGMVITYEIFWQFDFFLTDGVLEPSQPS